MELISFEQIELNKESFASGAYGAVFMAKWGKKDVVVKVIKARNEKEEQAVKSEGNLTLHLNHRNVIMLFGITCIKSRKFGIVMEKADHGSLDTWIGKMDHEKLTKIALDIIDGLEYVHSQHVIHRDIKPQNILMCGPKDDMIPKIADFGVSKVIETVMKTHTAMAGSLIYMAPEVRLMLQYSFTADIFSLAMMLFEMFNNQLITESSEEVKRFMLKLQGGRIDEIPESCEVPLCLRDVIKRGWKDEPEERPTLDDYRTSLRGKIFFIICPMY